jgi:hypothetical protein
MNDTLDMLLLNLASGPCFVCGRRMRRHTPRQLRRCIYTPLNLRITDQGRARLAASRHQDRRS